MAKLLVIEDDLLLDDAYRRKFGDEFDLRIATDGESGLKIAESFLPDVIILDIYMPGKMNGLDALGEVKKREAIKNIPVIVITNLPDSVERVMEMGAVKCFMKTDVDLQKIADEVESVLAKNS